MKNQSMNRLNRLTLAAMFTAFAYIVMFVLRIPGIGGFLTFDLKDAVITVAALLLGPISGVVISLLVALLEMITVSGTGHWGALMNFASSAVFAACASAVYLHAPRLKKKVSGAWCGLGLSILAMTVTMLGMNLLITPIYSGLSVEAVADMLVPLLLPFNLIKALLNASMVMLLYKPVTVALRRSRLIARSDESTDSLRLSRLSIVVFCVSVVLAAVCVFLLIRVFGGHVEFFSPIQPK